MNELVILEKKNQAVTTSRNISETFHKKHHHVLEKIRNLDCSKEFWLSNFRESNYTDSRNKKQIEYLVTKDGFSFLVMGFNGKKAAEFKEAYIEKFNQMEEVLKEKQLPEWKETRQLGKQENRNMTDAIKKFVEYAESQGSKNFARYYSNFQKLANKSVGIGNGKRDLAGHKSLFFLVAIMGIIEEKIYEGIQEGMFYKDIYKACKSQIDKFEEFIPTTLRLNA